MKIQSIFLLSLVLCATLIYADSPAVGASGFPEEDGIIVLNDSNFDATMEQFPMALVEFYAPWCGHCQKLAPEWVKAAKKLRSKGNTVPLVKFDAEANPKTAKKMEIEGYPTLKWWVNGKFTEYQGPREAKGISAWVIKSSGEPTTLIADNAALETAKDRNQIVVVYFGSQDSQRFKDFQHVARSESDLAFSHVFNPEMVAEYGERVVLWKEFDEGRNDLEGEFDSTSLAEWLEKHRFELVMLFEGNSAIDRIFTKERSAFFLFQKKDGDHTKLFTEVAEKFRDQLIFTKVKFSGELGKNVADYVGVTEADLPCARILNTKGGDIAKFVYGSELTVEGLSAFANGYLTGDIKRSYKSAAVPETNDKPVKVIVGTQWREMVINNTKDVLVEYYAPWCGHCKTLAPKYDKLAYNLMHMSDNLLIAKMDATENEAEGVSVESFPTLIFYPGNAKDTPKDYSGARNTKALTKFLKKHATFAWSERIKPALKGDQKILPVETPAEAPVETPAEAPVETDL